MPVQESGKTARAARLRTHDVLGRMEEDHPGGDRIREVRLLGRRPPFRRSRRSTGGTRRPGGVRRSGDAAPAAPLPGRHNSSPAAFLSSGVVGGVVLGVVGGVNASSSSSAERRHGSNSETSTANRRSFSLFLLGVVGGVVHGVNGGVTFLSSTGSAAVGHLHRVGAQHYCHRSPRPSVGCDKKNKEDRANTWENHFYRLLH